MKSSEIASYLKKDLNGDDIDINGFSSLSNIVENTIVFAKKHSKEYTEILNKTHNILAIVCDGYESIKTSHIVSANPRLDFMRVVGTFFVDKDIPEGIHPTANIEIGAVIGHNVSIGANCYIGSKVKIGDNTTILPNCSIYGKVTIGNDCYIKPGVVIGGPGFGFEYDENNVPIHFPHTGTVIIGNNVFIGSNTTIDRATIDDTVIGNNVKIDNLVQIAHNCIIGENTIITTGAIFSGGVVVSKQSWISPNSTIMQQLKLGEGCKVGIGAVVMRNLKEKETILGNPGRIVNI